MKTLKDDFFAGLVVCLVALPLCLGIAVASGAPPFAGLVAGVIGGVVVGLLSGSHTSVSGPAAGLTLLVYQAVTDTFANNYAAFGLAVVLAGGLQLIFGALRAGGLSGFVPKAVVQGMLAAIGLTIAIKQLPHVVGYDVDRLFEFDDIAGLHRELWSGLLEAAQVIEPGAVLITLTALAALLLEKVPFIKRSPSLSKFPFSLLAVAAGTAMQALFVATGSSLALSAEHLVALPDLQSLTSAFNWPQWSAITQGAVMTTAATIAVVASVETLLCLEAVDRIDRYKRRSPPNRELVAQGFGNMLSGLLGGLPLTSVVVRSSANVFAGSRTRMSTIIHGVLLASLVLFAGDLLRQIPFAALASVLLVVGLKLASPAMLRQVWQRDRAEFALLVLTTVAVMTTDLLKGVGIGMAASLAFVIYRELSLGVDYKVSEGNGVRRVRLILPRYVSFLSKVGLGKTFDRMRAGEELIIDLAKTVRIDSDVADALTLWSGQARDRKVKIQVISPAMSGVMDALAGLSNTSLVIPSAHPASTTHTSGANTSTAPLVAYSPSKIAEAG